MVLESSDDAACSFSALDIAVRLSSRPCELQRRKRRPKGPTRIQSSLAGPATISASAHAHRQGRRLEKGRDAVGRAGPANQGLCHRLAASALALCAAQWRRAGSGIEGAARASSQAAEGYRDEMG